VIEVSTIELARCQRCPSAATLRFTDLATGTVEELCEACADIRFAQMKKEGKWQAVRST
jgi:protein-arginine kinase activator protein McsA